MPGREAWTGMRGERIAMGNERQSRLRVGYGSEWHLLRYLGRHRAELSADVRSVARATSIEWLDFDFSGVADADHNHGDLELTGVEFLPTDHPARAAWREFWPQRGSVQNWDAVGWLQYPDRREWLLLEAKANVEELRSASGAKHPGSVSKIGQALEATKLAMGVDPARDWTQPYYQYANRLAFMHFLSKQGVAARMCFLYFTGDAAPGRTCPRNAKDETAPRSHRSERTRITRASHLPAGDAGSWHAAAAKGGPRSGRFRVPVEPGRLRFRRGLMRGEGVPEAPRGRYGSVR